MNPTVFRLAVLAGWGLAHPSWAFVVPPNTNTNSNTNTQAPGVVVFGTTTDHGEEASNTRREAPTTTTATATTTTTTTTNTHHPTKEPLVDVVAEMTEKALLEMGPNEMTMDDVAVALRNKGFVDTTTADDDANAVATLEADPVEEGITTTAAAALDQTWAETLEIASPSSTISNSNSNSNEDDANEMQMQMQIQMQMEIGRDDDPDLDELVSQVLAKNGIPSVATKDDDDDDTVRTAAMDAAMDADADESEIPLLVIDNETDHDAAVAVPSAATENPASALATSENNNNNKDTKDIAKNNKDVTWFELIGAAAEAAGAIGGVAIRAASDVLAEGAAFSISRETVKADVSVPYESASFLAYTEWLVAHHKEDPELDRYENFRTNYKRVAIANVVAKKGYRDALLAAGEEEQLPPTAPELLCLDQYADLSEEEYRQIRESMKPRSVGDLLGQLASRTGKAAVDMANTIVVVDEASRNRRSTSTSTSTSTSSKDNTKDSTPEPTEQKPETPGLSFSVGTMPFSFSKTADKKSNKKPAATETKKSPVAAATKTTTSNHHQPFSFLAGGFRSLQQQQQQQQQKDSATPAATTKSQGKASPTTTTPSKKQRQQTKKKPIDTTIAKSLSFLARAPTTTNKTPPTTKPKQPQAPAQPTKTNFFHRLGSRTLTSSKKQTSPNPKSAKKTAAMGITRTGTSTSTSTSTIPALSQWRQNRDGSITGYVSNSQTYRTGTKITTSPVSQDARGGTVVETDSGSRYRLK